MMFDRMGRSPLTAVSQLGNTGDELCLDLCLGLSPYGASSAALKEDCLINQDSAERYCSPQVNGIGTATSNFIFHLPYPPLSHRYRTWKWLMGTNVSLRHAQWSF